MTAEFTIVCYGETKKYPEKDRITQMEFYENFIYRSEGCERDRYVSVFFALANRQKICDDLWAWKYGKEIE